MDIKKYGIAVVSVIIIILAIKSVPAKPKVAAKVPQPKALEAKKEKPEPVIYDINKIKKEGTDRVEKKPADLKEMYEGSSIRDAGDNMPEKWARMSAAQKKKLITTFDDQIKKSEETLKIHPNDKHAKNILLMSMALKKMAENGFNYKFKNKGQ